jgi:hypothetical protein
LSSVNGEVVLAEIERYLSEMKVSGLTPGIYKIRSRNRRFSFRGETSAGYSVHLLRVVGIGAQCKYFIDQDIAGCHPKKMAFSKNYQVISRYSRDPEINRAQLLVSFSDQQGDKFTFIMNDAWRLGAVLESLPWLKAGFEWNTK